MDDDVAIDVRHVYPRPRTTSFHIEHDEPTLLRVIGVIPQGIQIMFPPESRTKLRAYFDTLDERDLASESAAPKHERAIREGMRLAEKEFEQKKTDAQRRGAVTRARLASLLGFAYTLGYGARGLEEQPVVLLERLKRALDFYDEAQSAPNGLITGAQQDALEGLLHAVRKLIEVQS